MRNPARLLIWILGIVVLGLVVFIAAQTIIKPDVSNPIERIEYSQYQAAPDYDDASYTVTEGPRIAEFQALLTKYSIDVADFNSAQNDGCTGGLATNITLYTAGNHMQKLNIYSCRGPKASGDFVADATALFSSWHREDAAK